MKSEDSVEEWVGRFSNRDACEVRTLCKPKVDERMIVHFTAAARRLEIHTCCRSRKYVHLVHGYTMLAYICLVLFNMLTLHTLADSGRGSPTLKDAEQFRNGITTDHDHLNRESLVCHESFVCKSD